MVTLVRYLKALPPNEGCRWKKDHKNYPLGVAVETQLLIVFIEEHFIQSFIQLKYKAINVLSGDLYQGDPDLYWSFTFYSFYSKHSKRHVTNLVCGWVCLFLFFAEWLQRVLLHSWYTKTSSIFLCRPAYLNRSMTDTFCCLTRLLPIYTLIF